MHRHLALDVSEQDPGHMASNTAFLKSSWSKVDLIFTAVLGPYWKDTEDTRQPAGSRTHKWSNKSPQLP